MTATMPAAGAGAAGNAGNAGNAGSGAPSTTAPIGDGRRLRFRTMAFLGLTDLAVDVLVFGAALFLLILIGAGIVTPIGLLFTSSYGVAFVVLVLVVFFFALFNISLLLLPAFLRGFGWFERWRTNAVYGTEIVGPDRRRTAQRGFKGFLEQWRLDATDSAPWRALGHLVAGAARTLVFGFLVVAGIGGGLALCFAPLARWQSGVVYLADLPNWSFPLLGVAALAIGIAAAISHGFVDRILSRAILGISDTAAMQRRVEQLAVQRTGAVEAAADQRRRIERDLHDDVQPRLVSIAMTLGMAKGKLTTDLETATELVEQAHAETKEAISELRRLVQGFQPAVLADRGLDAALSAVVARCPVPTKLDTDLPEPGCTAEAEAVVYFAVSEALTNVAKHARATRCSVQVQRDGDRLIATITDDGIGGASIGARSAGSLPAGGLTGMQDRAVAAGGAVRVASPTGGPTTVTVEVPCAS